MSAVPLNFDTLAYVKQLEAVGVPREQAEVQAEALRAIIDEKLATKLDVAELKRDIKELDAKTESVRAELKRDIKELDAKIESVKAELKRDIESTKAQLQADMSQLRIDTTRDLRELEMRMLIKLGGMMAASIAVVAALVKLL